IKVERLMHRNSIGVLGESAIAYCLIKLTALTRLRNVEMHIRPIRDVKIKRLRQVAPEIRPVELKQPEPFHLFGQLGTLERGDACKYVIDLVLPKRPDGKWVAAILEIHFDSEAGTRQSVTVPIEVAYTSPGHGYINAEVARYIDEIQVAELNASLQASIGLGQTSEVQKIAVQVLRKGEVMGKAGAKKTMLAKQVLQEVNAGGRVSWKTQPAGMAQQAGSRPFLGQPLLERHATIRYYSQM